MADPFEALVASGGQAAKPDPFEALASSAPQAKPQAPAPVDPFEALVAVAPAPGAAPTAVMQVDPFQALAQTGTKPPIEERAKRMVVENIPDSMKYVAAELGDYLDRSGIYRVLEKLAIPQQALTAAAIKGLDITNVAPGVQGRLNPEGNILPKGISPSDVIYDLLPSNSKIEAKAKAIADGMGLGEWAPESVRLLYASNKAMLGLVGDFVLDPINLIAAGAPRAAQATAKIGRMGVESSVAQKAIQAAAKGYKVAEEAPVVGALVHAGKGIGGAVSDVAKGSVDVWNSLLPYTRIKDLDEAWVLHSGMSKGINPSTAAEVFEPIRGFNVTTSEGSVLFNAMENITNAASKDDLAKAISRSAEKSKLAITPERVDQLADVGQHLRAQLDANIGREVAAGVRSQSYGKVVEESPGKKIRAGILEGYVPHRMSDSAREWAEAQVKAGKNPKEVLDKVIKDEMTAAGIELDKGIGGSWVSDFDAGKYSRKLRMPVEDANEYLKKGLGVDEFFVTDPISATAQKIAETKKLAVDKGLLDIVKKYGVPAEKAPRGWKPIEHYSLSVTDNMRFPPEISDKIEYYLNRPKGGLLMQKIDQYQWLFKRLALAKPDYYLQNIGENATKAMALGATPRDFSYVTKVMSDKISGVPIKSGKGEVLIPSSQLRKEIVELGIDSGGAFKEGFDSYVNMGQKMTRDGLLKRVKDSPKKVLQGLMEIGERGENWSRRAMYISLRRQGLAPKDAAMTVERVLFDYGRVTPAMNVARRFVPFIQPVIKTANIAPELIRKNPRLYNFMNNNMFQAVQAAFNDDTTQQELYATMGKMLAPRYRQMQDPTFSVLLPGNSVVGKWLVNQSGGIPNKGTPYERQAGGNVMVQLKAPIQLDILNQLNLLSDSIMTGMGAGPVLRAGVMMLTGQDIFLDKDIDVAKDHADIAARANAAANTLLESALPFPNLVKQVKKWAKIGDPRWIEPTTVQVIHGNVGRFATITNLDKDFFFKAIAMKKYHEELLKQFMSRAASEQRSAPGTDKASQIGHKIQQWSQMAFSSGRKHAEVLRNAADIQRLNMARAGVINKMTAPEILKNIRLIEQNIKELNHSYRTVSEYRLKAIGEARATLEEIQGVEQPESDGEALPGGDATE